MVVSKGFWMLAGVLAIGVTLHLRQAPADAPRTATRDAALAQRPMARPAATPLAQSRVATRTQGSVRAGGAFASGPAAPGYSLDNDAFISVPWFGEAPADIERSFTSSEIADVTGDRRKDLIILGTYVSPTAPAELLVYAQKADGTLAPPQRYPLETYGIFTAVGDFNEDGAADMVVAASKHFELLASKAGGGFQRTTRAIYDPVELYAGLPPIPMDVNADGHLDLVFYLSRTHAGSSSPTTDTLSRVLVRYGDGKGGFPTRHSFRTHGVDRYDVEQPISLATGDLNGDGRPDLVVRVKQFHYRGQRYEQLIRVFVSDSAGQLVPGFDLAASRAVDNGYASMDYLGVGDFNGDGRDDIAGSAGSMEFSLWILHQTQPGRFDLPPQLRSTQPIGIAFEVADLDGNRGADLLIGHDGWTRVTYYLQDQNQLGGEQMREVLYNADARINQTSVSVGDLTGDSCPDAAITQSYYGLRILRGTHCALRPAPVVCRTQTPPGALTDTRSKLRVSPRLPAGSQGGIHPGVGQRLGEVGQLR